MWDLHDRLPAVLAAMRAGRLDQPRAQVFSTWTGGPVPAAHRTRSWPSCCPMAPEMTTGELIDAIAKLAIALDPEWTRRRYERALRGRRVVGRRNPDGTATLTGHDLPADEVATACAHLDALATAAKAAGHPDRLDHLRADLLLGLLTGRYTGLTDQQILTTLLATAPTDPTPRHRPRRPRRRPTDTRRRRPGDDGDDDGRRRRPAADDDGARRRRRRRPGRPRPSRRPGPRTMTATRTTTARTATAQTTMADPTTTAPTTTAQTHGGPDDDGPDDDGRGRR